MTKNPLELVSVCLQRARQDDSERQYHSKPDVMGAERPNHPGLGRRDPVELLYRRGRLENEHYLAAQQIRLIAERLGGGFYSRSPAEIIRGDVDRSVRGHGIERAPERLVRIYHDIYLPWAEEVEKRSYGAVTLLRLTLDVVVEGLSLNAIERRERMRNGSATEPFVAALLDYTRRTA